MLKAVQPYCPCGSNPKEPACSNLNLFKINRNNLKLTSLLPIQIQCKNILQIIPARWVKVLAARRQCVFLMHIHCKLFLLKHPYFNKLGESVALLKDIPSQSDSSVVERLVTCTLQQEGPRFNPWSDSIMSALLLFIFKFKTLNKFKQT